MTQLIWDQLNGRNSESGVNYGAFYPMSGGPGLVLNGLVSVAEGFVGNETTEHFVDGVKYLSFVTSKNFQAIVNVISAPREFAQYVGQKPVLTGFKFTQQPKTRFHFTYQTGVNTLDYKIHLVYNVLATPTKRSASTIDQSVSLNKTELKFDTVPVSAPNLKPTAHFVVDSTRASPVGLSSLKNMLYGTNSTPPTFPTPTVLLGMFV